MHQSSKYGTTRRWLLQFICLLLILASSNAQTTCECGCVVCTTTTPTFMPTRDPTLVPTADPSTEPTLDPTTDPTLDPTSDPTSDPSADPTVDPTVDPTFDPTSDPTIDPTIEPTVDPTIDPTKDPTSDPTSDPTVEPTSDPTLDPTDDPTADPTGDPTKDPTSDPTVDPTSDPTSDPTIDPTIDPTVDPTSDPTLDPTDDPTRNPTEDPTIDPTSDPTRDPTSDPTVEPTPDPTHSPSDAPSYSPSDAPSDAPSVVPSNAPSLSPTDAPTYSPSGAPSIAPSDSPSIAPSDSPTNPSHQPTTVPTAIPTLIPTTVPTAVPTQIPTTIPSKIPTKSPSTDPTVEPTVPTINPTSDPTMEPTESPSPEPTEEPTMSPTHSPTKAPFSLQYALKVNVDDQVAYDETANWMTYTVGSAAAVVTGSALIYGRVICGKRCGGSNHEERWCGMYIVDDQQFDAIFIYFMQIIDLYSDLILSIQFHLYYVWSKEDEQFPDGIPATFNLLFIGSLVFVVVPYFGNLASSMGVIQRIANSKVMSSFSKKYFQDNSKLFSLLVLLSGGSIRSLKFMSCNLMGFPMFCSGLSSLQIQEFRAHHLIGTVLMENIPQLAMQGFFMFHLKIYTQTVIISFVSSVINVVLSIKSEFTQCLVNQNLNESPFTIFLSWKRGIMELSDDHSRRFHHETGRRQQLSNALSGISVATRTVNILSSEPKTGGTMLYGVLQFDENTDSAKGIFDRFKGQKDDILRAIESVFRLKAVAKSLSTDYQFEIEISQTSGASREEKIKLMMEMMNELDLGKELISQVEEAMKGMTQNMKRFKRRRATTKLFTLTDLGDGGGDDDDESDNSMHSVHDDGIELTVQRTKSQEGGSPLEGAGGGTTDCVLDVQQHRRNIPSQSVFVE